MATQTLTQVRDIITRFRKTFKDIEDQKRSIQKQIEKEKQEQVQYGPMSFILADHLSHHKQFVSKMQEDLRHNIRELLKGNKHLREEAASHQLRDLDQFLIPIGQKIMGDKFLMSQRLMLAAQSWENLEAIVREELEKLPQKTWGKLSQAQRRQEVEKHKAKIKELEAALLELRNR